MRDIGDRMKANYENRSRHELVRRMPVIIRVDGKAFHTFTRNFERPFSQRIIDAMVKGALAVAEEAQGFKLGYVQSDEASFFLTDYDDFSTQGWFNYVKSKVETIAASVMTATFNDALQAGRLAHFDARAFNLPREEVANYFLWRAMDWARNSVTMYCGAFYSPKQMHAQGKADQHEMLHAVGKNWATDLSDQRRNGTFILRDGTLRTDVLPTYAAVSALVDEWLHVDRATSPERVDTTSANNPGSINRTN